MCKKTSFLLLCLFALAGCMLPDNYGNYLTDKSRDLDAIVIDAAAILTDNYPPTETSFQVKPPQKNDNFGDALYSALRQKGYQVIETDQPGQTKLYYIIDTVNEDSARLSLYIDKTRYSRLYDLDGLPKSNWSKNDGEQ